LGSEPISSFDNAIDLFVVGISLRHGRCSLSV
jgi:hypothetical protein